MLMGAGLALALALPGVVPSPAFALDGAKPQGEPQPPTDAFRSGAQDWQSGEKAKALTSLQYAAEQGHALAQWQLGRMYAAGDGVPRSDLRAFEYFSRIANGHADDNPNSPQGRLVANAFVALGQYYLDGIPDSQVHADPGRARELFSYAASYFGDPDAQYQLGRIYLDGVGLPRDPRLAARWLGLAANKRQYQAQAVLGQMLFKGDSVPRQAALGLMWLTLARESDVPWITEFYNQAFKQATTDERALALVYLERWLKTRRE
jgi:TPR repeat protein